MAKNIIVSDTILLGPTILDTKLNVAALKEVLKSGHNLVLLSNRPSECMKPMCGNVLNDEVRYVYMPQEEDGLSIKLLQEGDTIFSGNITYSYMIYGNGISVFDSNDNIIYTGTFLDNKTINEMIRVFELRGYKRANYCFGKGDFAYKFFEPQNGSIDPSDLTYGMQCGAVNTNYDLETIDEVEKALPNIEGYVLNGKPCFYNRRTNKLIALNEGLVKQGRIDINDSIFFLGDATEDVLVQEYGDLSCGVGSYLLRKARYHSKTLYEGIEKSF